MYKRRQYLDSRILDLCSANTHLQTLQSYFFIWEMEIYQYLRKAVAKIIHNNDCGNTQLSAKWTANMYQVLTICQAPLYVPSIFLPKAWCSQGISRELGGGVDSQVLPTPTESDSAFFRIPRWCGYTSKFERCKFTFHLILAFILERSAVSFPCYRWIN